MSASAGHRGAAAGAVLRATADRDGLAPLYGRDAEQAALLHMMTRLAAGASGVTVLHGTPGSGRSRLLRRGVALARSVGVQVLTAQGSPSRADVAYGVVEQLLARPARAAGATASTLSALAGLSGASAAPSGLASGSGAALGDGPTGSAAGGGAGEASAGSSGAVLRCRALLAVAHRPTLLAVDDVQWADAGSLDVLAGLLRRLGAAPLGVLLTVTGARGEFPDACAVLLDQAAALQDGRGLLLELGPLGPDATQALCADAGVPAPPPSDTAWWMRAARLSRGNPWLLRHALDELRREPGDLTEERTRTGFARAVDAACEQRAAESAAALARAPLALLRGLAVCRGLVPLERVAALVGLDDDRVGGLLRELRVSGLIDFRDPPRPRLTDRTAVLLAGLDGEARRRLHAEAARWAHRCDADEEALARLLLTTVPLGEPWVPSVLRRAARGLLARGEVTGATDVLERALLEPLAPAERAEVLLEASEAYTMTAPAAADRRLSELLSGAPASRVRTSAADLLLTLGAYGPVAPGQATWYRGARPAAAVAAGQGGVPGPRAAGDAQDVAGATDAWDTAVAAAASADGGAPGPAVGAALLVARAWRQAVRGEDAAAVTEMCREVLRTAPLDGSLFPRLTACCALSLADGHGTARTALDVTLAEARRRRSPSLVTLGLLLRAHLNLRAGDPDTAAHDLCASRDLIPPQLWHPARLTTLRAAELQLLVVRERYEEAARLAAEELPPGAEESSPTIQLLYNRAQLWLCLGRTGQALAEAEECGRRLAARGWANPSWVPWRSLAALARLGCGDRARAEELFAEETRLARRWGSDSAYVWAELRRQSGVPGQSSDRTGEGGPHWSGRTAAGRRSVRAVVAQEAAGLRRGTSARSGTPAPGAAGDGGGRVPP
ncbi:AAA family ATPase [Streptomyces heilongjiangensis]|uniref:AAA family ATPase n=1 Tax=Streptomyces heilongjiangensis TaxID=945052 RepID=A0ABW1BHY5_9ACTN|nr:ATP-binding protein [Streptomyces heilongjiangensis]MDC2951808.1 ATP-binding protein [Streptomyces heilongjiangensis]